MVRLAPDILKPRIREDTIEVTRGAGAQWSKHCLITDADQLGGR